MAESALRYRAFLSYSHRDSAVTQRLHRRLETFRVPRALDRVDGGTGALPARLHPVFRDRDELASSTQLSHAIQRALDESEALVVVCSPSAAASPWVDAEIDYFRRHHPERPVLAFVVEGDPGLDPRQHPGRAALPLRLLAADPSATDGALGEPLAADARAEADGFNSAFFKLAAGLLGVRYDDLRQRDQRRRQRRATLAIATALLLAMLFAWLAWDATKARDAARRAQAAAELELRSERQTREFLLSVFHLADANEARGERVTVREVLDRAVQRIDRTRFDRPVVRSRFLATMGQAYASLGLNRRSIELLRDSIGALDSEPLTPELSQQRVASRIELADTLFDMGDYEAALGEIGKVAESASEGAEELMLLGRAESIRGDVLFYLERDADARAAYEAALRLLRSPELDAERASSERARAQIGLATLSLYDGDATAATRAFVEPVAALTSNLGADHPRTISATISMGSAAYQAGNRKQARSLWSDALGHATRIYDPDNPQIGTLKNNLGLLLLEDGEFDAAEPLLRDALASDRLHRSEDFDDLVFPLYNLGVLRFLRGDPVEAETLLAEARSIAAPRAHRMLGPVLAALADLRCSADAAEEGLALARNAVDQLQASPEADPWRVAQAQLTRAYCLRRSGADVPRAEADAALAVLRAKWPAKGAFLQRAQAQHRALR